MSKKDKTAYRYALRDISKYLREQYGEPPIFDNDQWIVTAYQMDCKEVRRLNRQLGVHSINKIGNTNGETTKHIPLPGSGPEQGQV